MKETFEWVQSWCDHTDLHDLPRVLLIGDSITRSYQQEVRERLAGKAYVDFLATSYAIDTKLYETLVNTFFKDDQYALVHFNNGLHGEFLPTRTYASKLKKIVGKMAQAGSKVILTTSTVVNEVGNQRRHANWHKIVKARNAALSALAAKQDYAIDDLYTISLQIPKQDRLDDGFHYGEGGVKILADAVAACILQNLHHGQ